MPGDRANASLPRERTEKLGCDSAARLA